MMPQEPNNLEDGRAMSRMDIGLPEALVKDLRSAWTRTLLTCLCLPLDPITRSAVRLGNLGLLLLSKGGYSLCAYINKAITGMYTDSFICLSVCLSI